MSRHREPEETAILAGRLSQAPVFSRLDLASRSEVARLAVRKEHRKGEFVFHQGETWPFTLYLASGRLEWSILSPDGRRQALFDPGPGDIVWGHTFFDDQPMPASLETLDTSLAYRWDRETLRPVLSRNPTALWDLCRVLVGSTRRVREIVYGFAFQNVSGRVARLLLMHYPFPEGQPIRRSMTLEEMAAHVGSTPGWCASPSTGLPPRATSGCREPSSSSSTGTGWSEWPTKAGSSLSLRLGSAQSR